MIIRATYNVRYNGFNQHARNLFDTSSLSSRPDQLSVMHCYSTPYGLLYVRINIFIVTRFKLYMNGDHFKARHHNNTGTYCTHNLGGVFG